MSLLPDALWQPKPSDDVRPSGLSYCGSRTLPGSSAQIGTKLELVFVPEILGALIRQSVIAGWRGFLTAASAVVAWRPVGVRMRT